MFAKKLIAIAAAVALAVAHVAAVEEAAHINVKIIAHHHTKQDSGNDTATEVDFEANVDYYESGSGSWSSEDASSGSWSSEDASSGSWAGETSGSADDSVGSSESSGSADDSVGSSEGSSSSWVDSSSGSGNYGETPSSSSSDDVVDVYCDGDDASPMSVEGVEGTFCVSGQACAGVEGACPGPQDGLEFGSYCGTVASGVLGCKPYTEAPFCTGKDESQMSVEGVEGIFCVTGQACAGVEGACPGPQDGLEYGSHCGTVASGVLGCKPNDAKHHKKGHFAKHPAHFKPTHYKPAKVKAASIKVDNHKKVTVKKVDHKKPATVKKTEIKKAVHVKKVEVKKPVHKVTVHKVEAKKPEHKKVEVKKVEHKKPEHKKEEHKKVEHKKEEHKKVEHKKEEHKKEEHKKVEHKKEEHKKVEHKH